MDVAYGGPWRDLPERYGSWKTCDERLSRWSTDGTWDKILAAAQVEDDVISVEWIVSVDSTIVSAGQYAAGVRNKGALASPSTARRSEDPAAG